LRGVYDEAIPKIAAPFRLAMTKIDMQEEEKKISQNRQKKMDLIGEYTERVDRSKGLVFADYQGLTHQQLETLKRAVRKIDGEFVITKNTLILRALSKKDLSDDDKNHFNKPTATLFMYGDIIEPLKELAKTIKALNLPSVKFGIIEGKSTTAGDVIKLSTLPPMDVLRAQLLGQMLSPIQGLHRALSWNMQSLVMTLQAISDKRQETSDKLKVKGAKGKSTTKK
jgi:large subunit ribosomal protein L10